jgi:hypothetical protein
MPVDRAVYIVAECCKELSRRDIRRPITPAMIELASDGTVIVGDPIESPHWPGYAAPELITSGQPAATATARSSGGMRNSGRVEPHPVSDSERARWAVFGLGCVLWELLAGRPLFRGDTDYQSAELAGACRVPPLAVPADLERIVRTALAKDPDVRYQTPSQLGDALIEYLVANARN